MAKQTLNVGAIPNDGTGDGLRPAMQKVEANFTEIYTTLGDGNNLTNSVTIQGTPGINMLTYWNSGTAVTGNADLTWDQADNRLSVNGTIPKIRFTDADVSGSHQLASLNNIFEIHADIGNVDALSAITFLVDNIERIRTDHTGTTTFSSDILVQTSSPVITLEDGDSINGAMGTMTGGEGGEITFSSDETNIDAGSGFFFRVDGAETMRSTSDLSLLISGTNAVQIPVGTTAERPTPAVGMIRYNTDLTTFEGWTGADWDDLAGVVAGGATIITQDEGIEVDATASTLNFVGAGVTATDAGSNVTTITIPAVDNTLITQDEGANVDTTATTLNFIGGGVTATDAGGGVTDITIPGGVAGSVPIQDDAITIVSTPTAINFTGAGVTVTDVSDVATVDIPQVTAYDLDINNETVLVVNNPVSLDFQGVNVDVTDSGGGALVVAVSGPEIQGTPVANQIASWSSATGIDGEANLTFDGSLLDVTGDVTASGVVRGAKNVNVQTGTTYNLALSDLGGIITMNNAGANTVEILPEATVALPIGFHFEVIMLGAGTTRIEVGDFVSLNGAAAAPSSTGVDITAQYGVAYFRKVASDAWVVDGVDVSAVT